MDNKPTISVIATAFRVNLWMEMYNFFNATNKVSFEMIFVGHVKPEFKLPENFKFIYTKVKPAQCLEIAARESKGKFIVITFDDCVVCNNFLDILYAKIMGLYKNGKKIIVSSFQMREKGSPVPYEKSCFWYGDKKSPRLPMGMIIGRKEWEELGGIDKNFIGGYGDLDIAMRMVGNGGKIVFCKEATFYERCRKKSLGFSLGHTDVYTKDRKTFDDFWVKKIKSKQFKQLKQHIKEIDRISRGLRKNNSIEELSLLEKKLIKKKNIFLNEFGIEKPLDISCADEKRGVLFRKRLCPVESFEDKEILLFSQGKKHDRWI